MNAQKARGAQLDTGKLTERLKALVPILIPLFISAFRRADELAMAMECRCYRGGRTRPHPAEGAEIRPHRRALRGVLRGDVRHHSGHPLGVPGDRVKKRN